MTKAKTSTSRRKSSQRATPNNTQSDAESGMQRDPQTSSSSPRQDKDSGHAAQPPRAQPRRDDADLGFDDDDDDDGDNLSSTR